MSANLSEQVRHLEIQDEKLSEFGDWLFDTFGISPYLKGGTAVTFAQDQLTTLKAENDRLREAIETALPHFGAYQIYDKGSEEILRKALEAK